MKNNNLTLKRKAGVISLILTALLCCIFAFTGIYGRLPVDAQNMQNFNESANLVIGELASGYQDTGVKGGSSFKGYFNALNTYKLFRAISGGITYDSVVNALDATNSTTNRLAGLATPEKVITADDLNKRNGGKDIIVTLGGQQWTVVFVSSSTDGTPIATLMLADVYRENGVQYNIKFGYADDTGSSPKTNSYLTYGTSVVRSALVGSTYATSLTAAPTAVSQNTTWYNFLYSLSDKYVASNTNFFVAPEQVAWQEKEDARGTDFQTSLDGNRYNYRQYNEGWGTGLTPFPVAVYNTTNYYAWKEDYIWLPSMSELGKAEASNASLKRGIWQTTDNQITTSLNNSGSSTNDKGFILRGCAAGNTNGWDVLRYNYRMSNGRVWVASGTSPTVTTSSTGPIRPCLHLNLKAVADAVTHSALPYATDEAQTSDGANNGLTYNGDFQYALNYDPCSELTRLEYSSDFTVDRNTQFTAIYENGAAASGYEDWLAWDENGGLFSAINAGSYRAYYKIKDEYKWNPATKKGIVWEGYVADDDDNYDPDAYNTIKTAIFSVNPKGLKVNWDYEAGGYEKAENGTYYRVYDGKAASPVAVLEGVCERDSGENGVGLYITYKNLTVTDGKYVMQNVTAGEWEMTARLDFSKITNPNYQRHVSNNYRLITGVDEDGNDVLAATTDVSVNCAYTIRKRTLGLEWRDEEGKLPVNGLYTYTYDGAEHLLLPEIKAGANGGVLSADRESVELALLNGLKYLRAGATLYSVPRDVAVYNGEVAAYTATAQIDHINYELYNAGNADASVFSCEVKILPKAVKVIWAGGGDKADYIWTFNGSSQTPTAKVEGLVEGETLPLAIWYSTDGASWTNNAPVNAGKYTAEARKANSTAYNYTLVCALEGEDGYNAATCTTVRQAFEIAKKQVEIVWGWASSDNEAYWNGAATAILWQYDGKTHAPVPTAHVDLQGPNGEAGYNLKLTVNTDKTLNDVGYAYAKAVLAVDLDGYGHDYNSNFELVDPNGANGQRYEIVKRVITDINWLNNKGNALTASDKSFEWGELVGSGNPAYTAEARALSRNGYDTVASLDTTAAGGLAIVYKMASGDTVNFGEGVEWRAGEYSAVLTLTGTAANRFEFADGTDYVVIFRVKASSGSKLPVDVVWAIVSRNANGDIVSFISEYDGTDFIYNGEYQSPVALYFPDPANTASFEVLAMSGVGGNINAGSYTVYLLPSEKYIFKLDQSVCTYKINPLKVKLEWTANTNGEYEWFFTGNEIAPAVRFDSSYNDPAFSATDYNILFNKLNPAQYLTVYGGEIYVGDKTASAALNGNFEIVDGTEKQNYSILKRPIAANTAIWTGNPDKGGAFDWDYDGHDHAPTATVTVTIGGNTFTLELITINAASLSGSHYAYAILDASNPLHDNFVLGEQKQLFNILRMQIAEVFWGYTQDGNFVPATVDGSGNSIVSRVYDGTAHKPEAYYLGTDGVTQIWLNIEGEITDVGSATARITDDFRFDCATVCVITVTPIELEIKWLANDEGEFEWTYDGSAQRPEIDELTGVGGALVEGVDYTISSFTEAGAHKAVITFLNPNYTYDANGNFKEFAILAADISGCFEWVSDITDDNGDPVFSWQFNAKDHAPTLSAVAPFTLADGTEVQFTFAYAGVTDCAGSHTATATLVSATTADGAINIKNFKFALSQNFEITAFVVSVEWSKDGADGSWIAEDDGSIFWTYDGGEYAPVARYKLWDFEEHGYYLVNNITKRTNAATYTVSVELPANCVFATYGEDGKSTGVCSFTIEKASVQIEWKWTGLSGGKPDAEIDVNGTYYWVYDGESHAPEAYNKDTGDKLEVKSPQTDVCDGYIVTAVLTDAANYKFADENEATRTFNITVKEVWIKWLPTDGKTPATEGENGAYCWTYDGQDHAPTAVLVDGNGDEIHINGKPVSVSVSGKQRNAGEYGAKADDTFSNFAFSASAQTTQAFVILKRSLDTVAWEANDGTVYTYVYNGKSQSPVMSATGGVFSFEYTFYNAKGEEVAAIEDAGEYTVVATCTDPNRFIPSGKDTVSVVITPFVVEVKWNSLELEYTGYNRVPQAYYIDALGQEVALKVNTATASGVAGENINVGSGYRAIADFIIEGDKPENRPQNYVLPELAKRSATYKIFPKAVNITWNAQDNTREYDGDSHAADFIADITGAWLDDIMAGGLTVSYQFTLGGKVLTEQEVTNAGNYVVTIRLGGNEKGNYCLSQDEFDFIISKVILNIKVDSITVDYGTRLSGYTADGTSGDADGYITGNIVPPEMNTVIAAVHSSLSSEYTSKSVPSDGPYAITLDVSTLLNTYLKNYTLPIDADRNYVYTVGYVTVLAKDGEIIWYGYEKIVDDEFVFEYSGSEQKLVGYYVKDGVTHDIFWNDVVYVEKLADGTYREIPDMHAVNVGAYIVKAPDVSGIDFGATQYAEYRIIPMEVVIGIKTVDKTYGALDSFGNEDVLIDPAALNDNWEFLGKQPIAGDAFEIKLSCPTVYDDSAKVNGFVQAGVYYVSGEFVGGVYDATKGVWVNGNYAVRFVGENDGIEVEDGHDHEGIYLVRLATITDSSKQGTEWFYEEKVIEKYEQYFITIDKTENGAFKYVTFAGDQTAKVDFAYGTPQRMRDNNGNPLTVIEPDDPAAVYDKTKDQCHLSDTGEWAINYRITISNHEVLYGQWRVLIKNADEYVIVIFLKPYTVEYGSEVPANLTDVLVDDGYVQVSGAISGAEEFKAIAEAYIPLGFNQTISNRTKVGEYNICFNLNVPNDSPLSIIYKTSNADDDSNIGSYKIVPRRLTVDWGEVNFIYDGQTHMATPVLRNWVDNFKVESLTSISNGKQYVINDGVNGDIEVVITVITEGNFYEVGGHKITIAVSNSNYSIDIEDAAKAISITALPEDKTFPAWLMWLFIGLGILLLILLLIILILAKRKKGETVILGANDDDGFYDDYNPDEDLTGFSDPFYGDEQQ